MSTTYNALAAAIAQEENSSWPNNPGALEDQAGNPLTFDSVQSGYNALLNKLTYDASGQSSIYSPNMSLSNFENLYTGGDVNAANNIGSMLGVSTSTPLSGLSDQSLSQQELDATSAALLDNILPGQPALGNATVSATPTTSNIVSKPKQAVKKFAGYEADIVAVLLGLIMVSGAIFGLTNTKETVFTIGKALAK